MNDEIKTRIDNAVADHLPKGWRVALMHDEKLNQIDLAIHVMFYNKDGDGVEDGYRQFITIDDELEYSIKKMIEFTQTKIAEMNVGSKVVYIDAPKPKKTEADYEVVSDEIKDQIEEITKTE